MNDLVYMGMLVLAGNLTGMAARFLFYRWCRARAPRSLWCERRILAEARRRHNAFLSLLPLEHPMVIRGTAEGDLYILKRRKGRA